jgi:cell division septation protein DedD
MPAGIPVEPSALVFEATDGGFGDVFGEAPPPAPAADLELDQVSFAQYGLEQSRSTFIDNQPAANFVTQTSIGADDVGLPKSGPVEQTQPELAPHSRRPASFGGGPETNGQNAAGEVSQQPILRRTPPRKGVVSLPDFGQAIESRVAGQGTPDTSFSDLAEATGLRRNTGPIDAGTPGAHPRATIRQHESPNSYPVLINGDSPSVWSRLRWPVVVMLLLTMLATVGYFLGFQKWIGGGKLEPRQSASVRPPGKETPTTTAAPSQPEEASKPSDPNAKPTEGSTGEARSAIKEPEPTQAEAAPSLVTGNTQPTHSLQAASFPNEAGAKEFAGKLVRAGVPAYVLSVDIPRRGRWFRVRVGQFPNAGEAAKYSVQARQRAKAAGMNLDLMVCNYERP